jgi:hypothetical protein
MISIAAAGVIAAGLTGCGSSSTTAATSTSGIQTAVKAVDGYVMNATVTGYWLDEDNTTMRSITLTGTDSERDITAGTWTDGSSTYSLPADTNDTVKNSMKFYKLSYKASVPATTTTGFKPATYLESGHSVGFDSNDTAVATNFTMYAVANSGIISPISNLVYQANSTLIGTETTAGTLVNQDFNATTLASMEGNASKIMSAMCLSSVDMESADPVALLSSNPTFTLVNAALKGQGGNVANNLLSANDCTTSSLENTLQAISDAGANTALVSTLLSQVKIGAFKASDIAALAIDKSVANNTIEQSAPADNSAKFQVEDMNISATLALSSLYQYGDKVDMDQNPFLAIETDNDVNISNKSFNLVVKVENDKVRVNDTNNTSTGAVVLSIPFEMNSTDGTVALAIDADAMVKYNVRDDAGGYINSGELNTTVLGITTSDIVLSQTSTGTATVTFDVDSILSGAATAMDDNVTGTYSYTNDEISKVQVILQDNDSALARVIGTSTLSFPEATISGLDSTISGTGIELLDFEADLRSTAGTNASAANTANAISAIAVDSVASTLTATSVIAGNATTPVTAAGALLNRTIYINEASSATDSVDYNITIATTDGYEKNTSASATTTDTNVSSFVSYTQNVAGDGITSGKSNGTISIDTTPTVTSGATGHPSTVLTFKTTDEFGKALTTDDYNVTVYLNRAPASISIDESSSDSNATAIKLMDNGSIVGIDGTTNATSYVIYNALTVTDNDTDEFGNVGNSTVSASTAMANGTVRIAGISLGHTLSDDNTTYIGQPGENGSIGTGTNGTYVMMNANATAFSIYGGNSSANPFASVSIDTNGSNTYKVNVVNNNKNTTVGAMVNATYIGIKLKAYDKFGLETNSSSDLFLKFTKEF